MKRHLAKFAFIALLTFSASSLSKAIAQTIPGVPSSTNGMVLAIKLCSNCHSGKGMPAQSGGQLADVPTFNEIAKRPGQTAERIHGTLVMPRHPMPRIPLTENEMADLAAYILSLKAKD